MTIGRALAACAAGLALLAAPLVANGRPAGADAGSDPASQIRAWASSRDGTRRLTPLATLPLTREEKLAPGALVTVDPSRRFQVMTGFGAALTDASAEILQDRMATQDRDRLLRELFGRQGEGLGLSLVRLPIGASDFSRRHYSLDDMPKGSSDPQLQHFSMAPVDEAQAPLLRAARAINPGLSLIASPWSAPGWMKDSDSLIRGRLRPDAYPAFAAYLARYAEGMAARGLPIGWLTLQNEPDFEPGDYPGMRLEPQARAALIGGWLAPQLKQRKLATRILDWDHNWDKPENPLAVLTDPRAAAGASGVAWHCYNGDVAAMAKVHAAHPDKEAFITECSGGEWQADWGKVLDWMTDSLIIAPTRYGSRGTLLWNLALDENHGPHLGGCGDCRGVVTVDSRSGEVRRNVEYYVLGHASRFVQPGARRIASTEAEGLANVAFRNPDGSLVLIAHNRGAISLPMTISEGGRRFAQELPAGEVVTFVWSEKRGVLKQGTRH